jgi:uncharacterized LabA/DUF88 family protein
MYNSHDVPNGNELSADQEKPTQTTGLAIQKLKQRIALLIDSETLEITVENMFTARQSERKMMYYPEWRSIVSDVVAGRDAVRLIYYKKQSRPINPKFEKMWTEELSGEVRQPEKSVDPYLIIDAVTLSEKVDCIVILAGDKDYLPLVWYLKSRGCKVEIANFMESTARIIVEQADRFHELNADRHVLMLPEKY